MLEKDKSVEKDNRMDLAADEKLTYGTSSGGHHHSSHHHHHSSHHHHHSSHRSSSDKNENASHWDKIKRFLHKNRKDILAIAGIVLAGCIVWFSLMSDAEWLLYGEGAVHPTDNRDTSLDDTPVKPEEDPYISVGEDRLYTTGDMVEDTRLSVGSADVITDKTLTFEADVSLFSGLRIGHGYQDYTGTYIEIDGTSIRQCFYTHYENLLKEEAHRLDIRGNIRVTITVNARRVATVTLESNGKKHVFSTSTNWYGSKGDIFAESLGSVLPNARLEWTCEGYSKTIHFYGDSYLSQSSDRWLHYAVRDGRTNALFDGYGGRGSAAAYASLVNNLHHCCPEMVVWMMGMNDGSDRSMNTPSGEWSTYRNKLIALSEEYGFEIIFATIPTVPKINHEAKNNWIRESGYRYIDVAAAVGADGTGAWTEGMLHTDNIHPTSNGAKAIYKQVLQDFPEFQ